jgi:hypothetical protein
MTGLIFNLAIRGVYGGLALAVLLLLGQAMVPPSGLLEFLILLSLLFAVVSCVTVFSVITYIMLWETKWTYLR